jgi:hypothetical protein
MEPTRRNIVTSLGALLFGGGALLGSSALFASSTEASADMRVVARGGVELLVGPAADAGVVTKQNGQLRIDFTSSDSGGVQPDATYQVGGIDVDNTEVQPPLNGDNVANVSGFPSPLGGAGTAGDNAGILVGNNSGELLGVTVDFSPDDASAFPADARVLVVMHDMDSAAGDTDVHARLFDDSGLVAESNSEQYRPVFSGEQLGVSLWVYTGYDTNQGQNQNPDLSGELAFTADDEGDVTVGSYP